MEETQATVQKSEEVPKQEEAQQASEFDKILNKTIQINTNDGRQIKGTLVCIDYKCNLILYDTEEFIPNFAPRVLGQCIVPGSAIQKCVLLS